MEEQVTAEEINKRELERIFAKFNDQFGELPDYLVLPHIKERFKDMGLTFDVTRNGTTINDAQDRYNGVDIDLMLENKDFAIAIEVRDETSQEGVDRHMERMAVLRRSADRKKDKRKFYGAMAGAIMTDEVKTYAQKQGFYTIIQTGDTVKIDIPDGFVPKNW